MKYEDEKKDFARKKKNNKKSFMIEIR